MKISSIILATLASSCLLLAGCSSNYSVDELVKDESKLEKVIAKCQNGDYASDSENCQNAQKALAKRVNSALGM